VVGNQQAVDGRYPHKGTCVTGSASASVLRDAEVATLRESARTLASPATSQKSNPKNALTESVAHQFTELSGNAASIHHVTDGLRKPSHAIADRFRRFDAKAQPHLRSLLKR
jgi:hypothetical protein